MLEQELCFQIQGCIYEVYRELGHGFLEKVYERALCRELMTQGLNVATQQPLDVHYKGERIGVFQADLVVEGKVLIELKAVEKLAKNHEAQLLNYLKATGIRVGLLVNFAYPKAEVRRFVF